MTPAPANTPKSSAFGLGFDLPPHEYFGEYDDVRETNLKQFMSSDYNHPQCANVNLNLGLNNVLPPQNKLWLWYPGEKSMYVY